METATTNNVSTKVEMNHGSERSNKKPGKEEKSKRKDDKSIDQVMKALNNLETTDEKLAAMCKKYAEVMDENRKLQLTAKQFEKGLNVIQREKEQLQTDHSKAVLTRSRLESLCRELQRQNKAVKEESLLKVREEEEKRKEVSAKFNATLSEITTLMSSSNEKTNKLRDENVDITKKFRSICEQSGLQQQQVDKMNMQRKLEAELSEAKMTKQKLEFTAEKEIMLREKQQLMMDLQESRNRIIDMTTNETTLRSQIALYSDRYEEFQNALSRSNEVFGGFKGEMDKMSKKIVKLEKETLSWKTRWEKSHQALLEMATDKQTRDAELALVQRQLTQLQKLCRTLQTERTGLLAKIRGSDETAGSGGEVDKLQGLTQASGIDDMTDLAGLLSTPVTVAAKLPDISDIFNDPTKEHNLKGGTEEAKGHKGSSPKSHKKGKGAAAVHAVIEPAKVVESTVKAEEKGTAAKDDKPENVVSHTIKADKAADVVVVVDPLKVLDSSPLKVDESHVTSETIVAEKISTKISSPKGGKKFKSADAVVDAVSKPVKEVGPSVAMATPVESIAVSVEPYKEAVTLSAKLEEGIKEIPRIVAETKVPKVGNQKLNKKAKSPTDSKPKEELKVGKDIVAMKTVGNDDKGDTEKEKAEPANESVESKVKEVTPLPRPEKAIPALSHLAGKEVLHAKSDIKEPPLVAIAVETVHPLPSDISPEVKPVESSVAADLPSLPAVAVEKAPQLVKDKAEVLSKQNKKHPTANKQKPHLNPAGVLAKPLENKPTLTNTKALAEVIDSSAKQTETTSSATNEKDAPQITEATKVTETSATVVKEKGATDAVEGLAKAKETIMALPEVIGALTKPTETAAKKPNKPVKPEGVNVLTKPAETSDGVIEQAILEGVQVEITANPTPSVILNDKVVTPAKPTDASDPLTTMESPQPSELSDKTSGPASSSPTAKPAGAASAEVKKGKDHAPLNIDRFLGWLLMVLYADYFLSNL